MKKFLLMFLGVSVLTSFASADIKKGKKLYLKKICPKTKLKEKYEEHIYEYEKDLGNIPALG